MGITLVLLFCLQNIDTALFDDIQNNLHFRDFVKKNKSFFCVLEFESKFIGIVGNELLFEK